MRISNGTVPEPPASTARRGSIIDGLPGSGVDARRTLWRLLEGVRGPGRAGQGVAEVDDELAVLVHEAGVAVEPARRGAALPLAVAVVAGPVAGALEPLRRLAPWHPTAQVWAGLGVDRHQPGL